MKATLLQKSDHFWIFTVIFIYRPVIRRRTSFGTRRADFLRDIVCYLLFFFFRAGSISGNIIIECFYHGVLSLINSRKISGQGTAKARGRLENGYKPCPFRRALYKWKRRAPPDSMELDAFIYLSLSLCVSLYRPQRVSRLVFSPCHYSGAAAALFSEGRVGRVEILKDEYVYITRDCCCCFSPRVLN